MTELFAPKHAKSAGLATMIQEIVQTHTADNEALPLLDRKAKANQ